MADDDRPKVDDRNPVDVIHGCIDRVLELAATWEHWDGSLIPADDREYTPNKALRRVTDHLLDHLAEVSARAAGVQTIPDEWRGSFVTTSADMATFEPADFDEARSRLTRIGQLWERQLKALPKEMLDKQEGAAWTLREVVFHVAESTYYAESVGDLRPAKAPSSKSV